MLELSNASFGVMKSVDEFALPCSRQELSLIRESASRRWYFGEEESVYPGNAPLTILSWRCSPTHG